jgi:hypothetical protein
MQDWKWFAILLASSAVGCGAREPEAVRVRYADLASSPSKLRLDVPAILEFHQGDRIPVELRFTGELFDMSPEVPAIELVAKRDGFVRIDGNGVRTSLDGRDFDARPKVPGSFQLGFSVTAEGTKLVVNVAAPRHGPPSN